MARLDDDQKRFIVRRIACFVPLTQIREEVKAEWGVALTEAQVSQYDPTTLTGERDLGPELKALFEETRESYIHDEEAVPIAHRAFRLNQLMEMLSHPVAQQSLKARREILEQAAKERGGLYEKPKPPQNTGGNALDMLREFLKGDSGDKSGESEGSGTGETPVEVGAA